MAFRGAWRGIGEPLPDWEDLREKRGPPVVKESLTFLGDFIRSFVVENAIRRLTMIYRQSAQFVTAMFAGLAAIFLIGSI